MVKSRYIDWFKVRKMWGRVNIQWNDIHEDVNILVGINGSGKTTLLDLMSDYYTVRISVDSHPGISVITTH